MFDVKDVEENKILAAVGYLGILCLVPLFFAKKSPYAQFHAKQAFVLFIAEVIVFFVNIIPILGQLIWFVCSAFFLVMTIAGIVKALNGEKWVMPVLGKYTKNIDI